MKAGKEKKKRKRRPNFYTFGRKGYFERECSQSRKENARLFRNQMVPNAELPPDKRNGAFLRGGT